MKIVPSADVIGAVIEDVDLACPLSDADFARIEAAFNKHAVICFPKQTLDEPQMIAFARRFGEGVRVPQLGWNQIVPAAECQLLRGGYAYFANSYRLIEPPPGFAVATADHGGPFVAAIERGPLLACQFHPELSGAWGIELLRRWIVRAFAAPEEAAC